MSIGALPVSHNAVDRCLPAQTAAPVKLFGEAGPRGAREFPAAGDTTLLNPLGVLYA
jgi:hypothetical protein